MKSLILCTLAATMLLLSNCKKDTQTATVAVTAVNLDKISLNILVNNADTLRASVSPDNATNGNISWSTSDNTVAVVDAAGHVTAKTLGSATITATSQDGTHHATCRVNVVDLGYFINAAASYALASGQSTPTENVSFTFTNNSAYPINIAEWDVYNSNNAPIRTVSGSPLQTIPAGATWNSTTLSLEIGLYEPGQTTLQNWLVLALINCKGKSYELAMTAQQATVTDL